MKNIKIAVILMMCFSLCLLSAIKGYSQDTTHSNMPNYSKPDTLNNKITLPPSTNPAYPNGQTIPSTLNTPTTPPPIYPNTNTANPANTTPIPNPSNPQTISPTNTPPNPPPHK